MHPLDVTVTVTPSPIADRIPEQISGIKKTGTDSAMVLFEWKLGNEVFKCMVNRDEDNPTTGSAEFGKYDNGWRVENINHFQEMNCGSKYLEIRCKVVRAIFAL